MLGRSLDELAPQTRQLLMLPSVSAAKTPRAPADLCRRTGAALVAAPVYWVLEALLVRGGALGMHR